MARPSRDPAECRDGLQGASGFAEQVTILRHHHDAGTRARNALCRQDRLIPRFDELAEPLFEPAIRNRVGLQEVPHGEISKENVP